MSVAALEPVWDELSLRPPRCASLTLESVARYYGRVRALGAFTATFAQGDVVAVLGPNGAGKSTLLRMLATLERPSEGRITLREHDGAVLDAVVDRDRIRGDIGLVSHDTLVYGDLSGRENLRFVGALYGVDPPVCDRWLARLGLDHTGDKPVREYSRGMRQRLSIARAMVHHPTVVLFDEPMTGLDRAGQAFLWSMLRWLRRERRICIVVTHRFEAPADVFTRSVVLDNGRTRQARDEGGNLAAIYESGLSASRRPGARAPFQDVT